VGSALAGLSAYVLVSRVRDGLFEAARSPDERDREIERLLEEEIARREPESAFEDAH